jgi:F-type H+-transporting ATPase subunit gamma
MAQLIQMRQRIKAVETIKKITHAMRLISMSTHTRLRSKQEPLKAYQRAINVLFKKIRIAVPTWHNSILYPDTKTLRPLIIIIGSQKGLCGNFNSTLFRLFETSVSASELAKTDVIAVGKKAVDYLKQKKTRSLTSYADFTPQTMTYISRQIADHLIHAKPHFSTVIVFSNKLKTFFVQKPQMTSIIPFDNPSTHVNEHETEFAWEQDPHEILDMLGWQALDASIQYLLFESLLAEQAARFISMDSSTRNAEKILEETILWYNKLRQAKITKELTELTGSF